MTRPQVVIVGAGAAGLGAAARLRQAGLEPRVLDRATTVGSAWRGRYESFRLHTIRWLSGLPGLPIPRAYGDWVARDDFVRYLEGYADRFGVRPDLGVELRGLRPHSGGWRLSTSDGDLDASHVVFATGACATPFVPAWAGRETSTLPITHSVSYRRPAPYAGRRVLVVGSGNSATEVAVDLVASGVEVDLAVRTPPAILRRDVHGLPTQPLGIALRHAPAAVVDPLAAATRRLTVPDLTAYGLPAPARPYSLFRRTSTIPVLDHGFVAGVQDGSIRIRLGVGSLDGDEVVHDDGTRTRPDEVIAATGYRPGLDGVLGPLGLLDRHGLPTFGSRGSAGSSGLFSVGISVPLSGLLREIGLDSRHLVRALRAA